MGNAVDPGVVGELLGLAERPHACLDQALRLLTSCPALAASVVRIGNSELCGMAGRINGARRAVLILGPERTAALAAAVLVAERGEAAALPRRLMVGTLAEEIARTAEVGSTAAALTAGLLHDAPSEWGLPHPLGELGVHLGEPLRAPHPIRARACTTAAALGLLDSQRPAQTLALELGVLPQDLPSLMPVAELRAKEFGRLLAG